MTNTSRRLRALASSLCQFEEADVMTKELLDDAYRGACWHPSAYMVALSWTGPLAPWRTTVQQELESIYADYQARQAD